MTVCVQVELVGGAFPSAQHFHLGIGNPRLESCSVAAPKQNTVTKGVDDGVGQW